MAKSQRPVVMDKLSSSVVIRRARLLISQLNA
jgi:hypothetical protein